MALAACTAVNPAFDDEGASGPQDTLATSSTDDGTGEGEASASGSSVTATGTTTTTDAPETTDDTGPEFPEPIEVGPFVDVQLVMEINDPEAEDDDPTLTDDMLEIYFNSGRGSGNNEIWMSSRASTKAAWDVPQQVVSLGSPASDDTPEISGDGLMMLFSSNRDSSTHEDVFMSTRRSREDDWTAPVPVPGLSTGVRDVSPFPARDGLHVYSCVGEGTVDLALVHFERDAVGGAWSKPEPIVELDSDFLDCGAWVDDSQQVIVFTSSRPEGLGADLWQARRPAAGEPFESPTPITELNSASFDEDAWVSPTGDTVFFASDRGSTDKDIYVAHRAPG
jgi:WD40-like Beta Propeller Repeat